MNPLRRLVPRLQEARCYGCGLLLRERRRKPCPVCNSLNRIVTSGWREGTTAEDKVG